MEERRLLARQQDFDIKIQVGRGRIASSQELRAGQAYANSEFGVKKESVDC